MIIALLAGVGQGLPGYAAEEGTVKATSAWQGQGRFFQVGKDQAFFVGSFEGIMYIETKTGALDTAIEEGGDGMVVRKRLDRATHWEDKGAIAQALVGRF